METLLDRRMPIEPFVFCSIDLRSDGRGFLFIVGTQVGERVLGDPLLCRQFIQPCQGRVCGAALECVMGWANDSVRPPSQPARLSTLTTDFSAVHTLPPNEQGVL